MARTLSNMLPLGTKAPDFTLLDTVSGNDFSLSKLEPNRATVIMFISNHCPFVKHIDAGMVALANDYEERGVNFIAISSNDVEHYPQDAPDLMKIEALKVGYSFPYLYDATQEVAKAYDAACTPDFYIFDNEMNCAYRGQLDDSRPGNGKPVTGNDMRTALDQILGGMPVTSTQIPSMGCNIKWVE